MLKPDKETENLGRVFRREVNPSFESSFTHQTPTFFDQEIAAICDATRNLNPVLRNPAYRHFLPSKH